MSSIGYQLLDDKCRPHLGSEGAGGLDLRACHVETFIEANTEIVIGLGIKLAIPKGWVGILLPRSGLGTKYKMRLANTAGVIDSDYRGEVKIICSFEKAIWIESYMRICQLIVVPCNVDIQELEDLGLTDRDTRGFGSSGTE